MFFFQKVRKLLPKFRVTAPKFRGGGRRGGSAFHMKNVHLLFNLVVWSECVQMMFRNLKITIIPPRNLFTKFKPFYFFLWRYDGNEKIFGCENINEEFVKKFWTTFVEKLWRNKGICDFCFGQIWGVGQNEKF